MAWVEALSGGRGDGEGRGGALSFPILGGGWRGLGGGGWFFFFQSSFCFLSNNTIKNK